MSPQIIFVNPTAKPQRPTPPPEAIAQTPAPPIKQITWGIQGRLHLPTTAQPQHENNDRPSYRLSREGRLHEPEAPKVRMRYVDRTSKLERLPGKGLLCEKLDRRTARPELEYLSILYSQKTQQYWIGDVETGKVFLPQAFKTLDHCYEAASEIERTFVLDDLELVPELLEVVEAIARACVWREQTELGIAVA